MQQSRSRQNPHGLRETTRGGLSRQRQVRRRGLAARECRPYAQECPVGLWAFALAPPGMDTFDNTAGRGKPNRARPDGGKQKRLPVWGIRRQKMVRKARVDSIN